MRLPVASIGFMLGLASGCSDTSSGVLVESTERCGGDVADAEELPPLERGRPLLVDNSSVPGVTPSSLTDGCGRWVVSRAPDDGRSFFEVKRVPENLTLEDGLGLEVSNLFRTSGNGEGLWLETDADVLSIVTPEGVLGEHTLERGWRSVTGGSPVSGWGALGWLLAVADGNGQRYAMTVAPGGHVESPVPFGPSRQRRRLQTALARPAHDVVAAIWEDERDRSVAVTTIDLDSTSQEGVVLHTAGPSPRRGVFRGSASEDGRVLFSWAEDEKAWAAISLDFGLSWRAEAVSDNDTPILDAFPVVAGDATLLVWLSGLGDSQRLLYSRYFEDSWAAPASIFSDEVQNGLSSMNLVAAAGDPAGRILLTFTAEARSEERRQYHAMFKIR